MMTTESKIAEAIRLLDRAEKILDEAYEAHCQGRLQKAA